MAHQIIPKNETEYIIANTVDDIENVDAKEAFIKFHADSIYPALEAIVKNSPLDETCKNPISIHLAAIKIAEEQINKTASLDLPEGIKQLFQKELSKKEQISLLKGVTISQEQLGTIFLYASDNGYKFSQYRFSDKPKKYIGADLPSFIHLKDDGTIEHYGETSLTDGQMKEIVIVSGFVLARILNNGTHWHCFYQNKNGVSGKESGQYGSKSHIHYISDSFGISLDEIIKGFKGGICPHSKVHIVLNDK